MSERKKNWERKQALGGALATQFRLWNWQARDLVVLAKRCVEAAYEAVMRAMIRLGWWYDHTIKAWRLDRQAAQP